MSKLEEGLNDAKAKAVISMCMRHGEDFAARLGKDCRALNIPPDKAFHSALSIAIASAIGKIVAVTGNPKVANFILEQVKETMPETTELWTQLISEQRLKDAIKEAPVNDKG